MSSELEGLNSTDSHLAVNCSSGMERLGLYDRMTFRVTVRQVDSSSIPTFYIRLVVVAAFLHATYDINANQP